MSSLEITQINTDTYNVSVDGRRYATRLKMGKQLKELIDKARYSFNIRKYIVNTEDEFDKQLINGYLNRRPNLY